MKLTWREGVAQQTRRTTKRIERARKHNIRKENGYFSHNSQCPYCGREMTWCSCCNTWSSNCCIPYGTCMCS